MTHIITNGLSEILGSVKLLIKNNKIMKVKLTLKAINDKVDNGKVVSSEDLNDALQITDFDGIRIAVKDFGKNLANALIMQQLPDKVNDVMLS